MLKVNVVSENRTNGAKALKNWVVCLSKKIRHPVWLNTILKVYPHFHRKYEFIQDNSPNSFQIDYF